MFFHLYIIIILHQLDAQFRLPKRIRVSFEGMQASMCAKINLLTAIHSTRIAYWVFSVSRHKQFLLVGVVVYQYVPDMSIPVISLKDGLLMSLG